MHNILQSDVIFAYLVHARQLMLCHLLPVNQRGLQISNAISRNQATSYRRLAKPASMATTPNVLMDHPAPVRVGPVSAG